MNGDVRAHVRRGSFDAARSALAADDAAAAIPMLEDLARADPADLDVTLHLAWARARTAVSTSEEQCEALEELARRALASGRSLALPLCILGHAAVRRGELAVARTLFRRASDADPTLLDARRGHRIVDRRLRDVRPRGPRRTRALPFAVALVALAGAAAAIATAHG